MSAESAIEWTDATWTPIRARVKEDAPAIARAKGYTSLVPIAEKMVGHVGPHCEHASPGCNRCYSEANNARCLPNNGTGLPFDRRARDLVDMFVDERILAQPLHWDGRQIFVCSQTDLFGAFVTDAMIDHVFTIMRRCEVRASERPDLEHRFQVLTKQPQRALEFLSAIPLPKNMLLGVSVEDQERATERRAALAAIAALGCRTWVSYEPALGHVDWRGWEFITWLVSGGESGREARPSHPEWHRATRDWCESAGVAYLFKQWGEWAPPEAVPVKDWRGAHTYVDCPEFGPQYVMAVGKHRAGRLLDGVEWNEHPQ